MAERDDEFYTGYLPQAPSGIARCVRLGVMLIFAVGIATALVLTTSQHGFAKSVYEFLVFRDFEGVVRETPYPHLEVQRPGASGEAEGSSYFSLVAPGKFGASAEIEGLGGQRVQLRGSLLYRDGETMIEVEPGSVKAIGDGGPAAVSQSLGEQTLRGEIVDSKCYYGIMKPGHGKPHKSCAIRCISGGIPPVFVLRDDEGPAAYLLLVGADGRAVNQEVLDMVAEPLEITGEVQRIDDHYVLRAEPSQYRRLL